MATVECERQLPILLKFCESVGIVTSQLGSATNCTVYQVSDQSGYGRYCRYDNRNPVFQPSPLSALILLTSGIINS